MPVIKCPSCRKQISDAYPHCPYCHHPITANIPTDDPRNTYFTAEEDYAVRCPKCNSNQITANNKGFGLGKAAIGGLLLGPVGLLGGVIGSKKIMINCLKCGHRWEPGQ